MQSITTASTKEYLPVDVGAGYKQSKAKPGRVEPKARQGDANPSQGFN